MEAVYYGVLFLVWYLLSYWISEKYGNRTKLGKQGLFAFSMFLSPVFAVLVVYLYRTRKTKS